MQACLCHTCDTYPAPAYPAAFLLPVLHAGAAAPWRFIGGGLLLNRRRFYALLQRHSPCGVRGWRWRGAAP